MTQLGSGEDGRSDGGASLFDSNKFFSPSLTRVDASPPPPPLPPPPGFVADDEDEDGSADDEDDDEDGSAVVESGESIVSPS